MTSPTYLVVERGDLPKDDVTPLTYLIKWVTSLFLLINQYLDPQIILQKPLVSHGMDESTLNVQIVTNV